MIKTIIYLNVSEINAGWGAECFMNKAFEKLGVRCINVDYRKYRNKLPYLLSKINIGFDGLLLQRGDNFQLDVLRYINCPKIFWNSELVARCFDNHHCLRSDIFDFILFRTNECIDEAVLRYPVDRTKTSVFLSGFDPDIHKFDKTEQDIDVLFVGTVTERRKAYLNYLLENLCDRKISIYSAYGDDMVRLINRSKIILNIHSSDYLDTETRIFEVLGAKGFLISEKLSGDSPFQGNEIIQFSEKEQMVKLINYYIENDQQREDFRNRGHIFVHQFHSYTNRASEIINLFEKIDRPYGPSKINKINMLIIYWQNKILSDINQA